MSAIKGFRRAPDILPADLRVRSRSLPEVVRVPGDDPPPGHQQPPDGPSSVPKRHLGVNFAPGTDGFATQYGLARPAESRVFAGVCAAVGWATNTDAVLWRVLVAVFSLPAVSGNRPKPVFFARADTVFDASVAAMAGFEVLDGAAAGWGVGGHRLVTHASDGVEQ